MEDTQLNESKTDRKSIIFLILMVIVIILLFFFLVSFIKNKNLIVSDPFMFGAKLHNFTSCSCYDSNGEYWIMQGNGFIKNKQYLPK